MPLAPADAMLSASAPCALSAHRTSAICLPPVETRLRRSDLRIVNETERMYCLRSPSLETAQKQSIISNIPASVGGEGQLARAAAYIQEHVKHRLFDSDEFPHCSPKEPPDKQLIVVNEEMKADANTSLICSEGIVKRERHPTGCLIEIEEAAKVLEKPALTDKRRSVREPLIHDRETAQDRVICSDVLQEALAVGKIDGVTIAPLRGLKTVKNDSTRVVIVSSPEPWPTFSLPLRMPASHTEGLLPFSWSSFELDGCFGKSPKDGDYKLRPYKVVSSSDTSNDGMCSPEDKIDVSSLISKLEGEIGPLSSKKAAFTQPDLTLSDGILERVERSYDSIGPATKRALAFAFLKEGEKRRIYDAIVSIQTESKRLFMPSAEAAHKQYTSVCHLSEVAEGMRLARATTYARERTKACSSAGDEFVHPTLTGPPDKSWESETSKEV